MAPLPRFHVYGLDETYPELGDYSFKIVLNPRFFKSGDDLTVSLIDSDRRPMSFDLKKWGRKLNVVFTILPTTADGVSTAAILRGDEVIGRLSFWIIKP